MVAGMAGVAIDSGQNPIEPPKPILMMVKAD